MIRVFVSCLLSVAFAHPYNPQLFSESYLLQNSQSYPYYQIQNEEPSRQVRSAAGYPLEMENYQGVPQVTYSQLDENAERVNPVRAPLTKPVGLPSLPLELDYQNVPQMAFAQLGANAVVKDAQDEGSFRQVRSAGYPLELENYQGVPQMAYIQLPETAVKDVQDEGSSRHVRGVEYAASALANNQAVQQLAFIRLDESTLRNIRSLVSDQSIDSKLQYENIPNDLFRKPARFDDQIPQFSNQYYTPQDEQLSQNFKPFSFDNLPYQSKPDSRADSPLGSGDSLKDYAKELIESNNKPVSESKRPRMFGFYYMNIQRYPVSKQVLDDSEPEQKFYKNKPVQESDLAGQVNENEILKYMQQILQQQISKLVQHQNQEHLAYKQMQAQPIRIKETIVQEPSKESAFDQLGSEEKKYLIGRLHQEEHWLEDSLVKVRELMNELQTDGFNGTSNGNIQADAVKLKDVKDTIDQGSSTTDGSYISTTTSSSVESVPDAFNGDMLHKDTA